MRVLPEQDLECDFPRRWIARGNERRRPQTNIAACSAARSSEPQTHLGAQQRPDGRDELNERDSAGPARPSAVSRPPRRRVGPRRRADPVSMRTRARRRSKAEMLVGRHQFGTRDEGQRFLVAQAGRSGPPRAGRDSASAIEEDLRRLVGSVIGEERDGGLEHLLRRAEFVRLLRELARRFVELLLSARRAGASSSATASGWFIPPKARVVGQRAPVALVLAEELDRTGSILHASGRSAATARAFDQSPVRSIEVREDEFLVGDLLPDLE